MAKKKRILDPLYCTTPGELGAGYPGWHAYFAANTEKRGELERLKEKFNNKVDRFKLIPPEDPCRTWGLGAAWQEMGKQTYGLHAVLVARQALGHRAWAIAFIGLAVQNWCKNPVPNAGSLINALQAAEDLALSLDPMEDLSAEHVVALAQHSELLDRVLKDWVGPLAFRRRARLESPANERKHAIEHLSPSYSSAYVTLETGNEEGACVSLARSVVASAPSGLRFLLQSRLIKPETGFACGMESAKSIPLDILKNYLTLVRPRHDSNEKAELPHMVYGVVPPSDWHGRVMVTPLEDIINGGGRKTTKRAPTRGNARKGGRKRKIA